MDLLPVTAIVASHDEGAMLARCLDALTFCDELIVIDIDSTDSTAATAERHGARVLHHEYVPIAEWARADLAGEAKHDWLLVVDPDEEVPAPLVAELTALFPTLGDDVAAVDAPRQYYFGQRALAGTVWGGQSYRRLLVRRSRVELTPTIWGGMRIKDGFRIVNLEFTPETAIVHRWVSGYRQLFRRHARYLGIESTDRLAAGEQTGMRAVLSMPWRAFSESYVAKKGYRDGSRGLALSIFWACFRTSSEMALLYRLRRQRS